MNTPQLDLRLTPVESVSRPGPLRRTFHPVRLFVDMNRAAWFWFCMFLLTLGSLVSERILTARRPLDRFAFIDSSGTMVSGWLYGFDQATNVHLQQVKLATVAFLNRDPLDFDQPEILRLMFLTDAWEKARRQFTEDGPERESKHWHQKAEISRIDFVETRDDRLLANVTGQLIRVGTFQNRSLSEAVPFRLSLKMLRNPDLTQNGRFPTAVSDFRYE